LKTLVGLFLMIVGTPWMLSAATDWSAYDLSDPELFAQGEINVGFEQDVDLDMVQSRFAGTGITEVGRIEPLNVLHLRLPDEMDVLEAISYFEAMPDVLYADPVVIYRAYFTPNDPYFSRQWHYDASHIDMPSAWDKETGDASVIIAIVDTGIAYEDYTIPSGEQSEVVSGDGSYHRAPDLEASKFVTGHDFVNGDDHPNDEHGHGTHVAGTVAQATDNGDGVAGMAFDCRLMPVRVLNHQGSGMDTWIANGITWATDNGADVINLSLGSQTPSSTIESAVQYADDHGVVVCAATGNAASVFPGEIGYPARYEECIAVGACDYNDQRAPYSQWGPGIDISAPGGNTSADENNDGYADGVLQQTYFVTNDEAWGGSNKATVDQFAFHFWQGTSMATPHVAGLAALLKSHGITTVDSIKSAIYETARDLGDAGYDNVYGYGMIDPSAALDYGQAPDVPVAEFDASPRKGAAPLSVAFTDASTGSPTSWDWDFGDGFASTTQNPNHTYDTAGVYTVTLIASNADGADTATKTDYIRVGTPTAGFDADQRSGSAPLTVAFTDASTGSPTAWLWDFGDGGTSGDQNPTHTYSSEGSYDVQLIVSNAYGADTLLEENYITVTGGGSAAPVANFSATPTSGDAPLSVAFTDASTGSPTSWDWDFGDGGASTDQNPTHVYNSAGTYDVTLIVANADGADTLTRAGYITVTEGGGGGEVTAAFSASPSRAYVPLTHRVSVQFTDASTGSPTSWSWDFGDGGTSTDQNPTHVYTCAATSNFVVQLVVSDGSAADTATDTVSLVVLPSEFYVSSALASAAQGAVDVHYGVPFTAKVEVSVYNASGRFVRCLVDEEVAAGEHVMRWELVDENGRALPPGVYFVRVHAEKGSASAKIVITR